MAPSRTLLPAHCQKRSQGSTVQSAASGRSMNSTGSTKPNSTGARHNPQASAQRQPFTRIGRASSAEARAAALPAKRSRRRARCSSHSSSSTSASSSVASCAAAARLSMASQAL